MDCKQFLYLPGWVRAAVGSSRISSLESREIAFGDLHHLLLTDRKRTETHRRIYTNTYALKNSALHPEPSCDRQ